MWRRHSWQRQVGHDARPVRSAGIDDGFVGRAQYAFHGFEIHSLARDVGRLLVLIVDLQKARGLSFGVGNGLGLVGLGVLNDLRGLAARLRHNAVGISLCFVLRTFEIGARGLPGRIKRIEAMIVEKTMADTGFSGTLDIGFDVTSRNFTSNWIPHDRKAA